MPSIDDIKTYGVQYIWKDDPDRTPYFGLVGETTGEVMTHLVQQIEEGNDEWTAFDDEVLYYIDSSKGETIEHLASFDHPADFMVIDQTED